MDKMTVNEDEDMRQLRAENRNARMAFPPSYVLVGIYRLASDRSLRVPMWDKCRHGIQRGAVVSAIWAAITYKIQKTFVTFFWAKSVLAYLIAQVIYDVASSSPRVTGLSHQSLFGISVTAYATLLFLSSQVELILKFFLSKNIRIAQNRAWDQTVKSRGKGEDFWQPYIEELQQPPVVEVGDRNWQKWASDSATRFFVQRVLLTPLNFYPVIGILIAAWFKGIRTARFLHKPYFTAKHMSEHEIAVFMEERKWDYRAFGFAAALVEGLPFIGLLFTVSVRKVLIAVLSNLMSIFQNRIGAAMWAHDLEKRQHMFRSGELKPLSPPVIESLGDRKEIESRTGFGSAASDSKIAQRESAGQQQAEMAGSWEDVRAESISDS